MAHPVWALAFRPFFLAAALLAAVWLPLWLLIFSNSIHPPLALDTPIEWHLHELIFGFAGAVLAGFLLTAASNWTKRPTASGAGLAAIFGLWVVGRLVLLFGAGLPWWLIAFAGLAYLPATAYALAKPMIAAANRRNYAFPILLIVLTVIGVIFHLDPNDARRAFSLSAVDVIVVFLVVMGGRVIPFFTRNALRPVAAKIKTYKTLDWACAVATGAVALCHMLAIPEATGASALVAGALNLVRVALWRPDLTLKHPILWVLHLGYAWIGVGLILMGLGVFFPIFSSTAPLHALTVGGLGTLTLGMMARVSLGHTGRPLVVAKPMVLAFVLITLSALVRVLFPLFVPVGTAGYNGVIHASGSLFSVAWVIFFIVHWPILTRPRADGAPG